MVKRKVPVSEANLERRLRGFQSLLVEGVKEGERTSRALGRREDYGTAFLKNGRSLAVYEFLRDKFYELFPEVRPRNYKPR